VQFVPRLSNEDKISLRGSQDRVCRQTVAVAKSEDNCVAQKNAVMVEGKNSLRKMKYYFSLYRVEVLRTFLNLQFARKKA
jgi:hypothetical protein